MLAARRARPAPIPLLRDEGIMLMRALLKPCLLGICLLVGQGCQFVCHLGRNVIHEPLFACDEKATWHRCEKLGKQAWNDMVHQHGEDFSCDYRSGFVDGFADYLYYGGCIGGSDQGGCGSGQGGSCAGGTCAAKPTNATGAGMAGSYVENPVCPPVPPNRYRRKRYMTPEGVAAVEDWYAGFRHGAATAMASGLRNLVVIPVQCPPKFGPDDGFQPETSNRGTTGAGAGRKETVPPMPPTEEITPPTADTLPLPRPVEANPVTPPLPGPGG